MSTTNIDLVVGVAVNRDLYLSLVGEKMDEENGMYEDFLYQPVKGNKFLNVYQVGHDRDTSEPFVLGVHLAQVFCRDEPCASEIELEILQNAVETFRNGFKKFVRRYRDEIGKLGIPKSFLDDPKPRLYIVSLGCQCCT